MTDTTLTAKGNTLTGYALRFNEPSVDLGGFIETIAPDALDRTKAERPDLRALVDHDPKLLIGRSSSGTLRYSVDARGLKVSIDPPDTSAGRDVVTLVRRRDVTGMSFRFITFVDDWKQEGARTVRTLRDLRLREVSAVTWPAYEGSTVTVDGSRAGYASRHDEAATIEQWNVRSPGDTTWTKARVRQAADVAKGRTRCALCQKRIAVAVRGSVAMCGPCLADGDAVRQRHFRGETAARRDQPHGPRTRVWWEAIHRTRLAK
jgi:HK97 family phage prohead protease